MLRVANKILEEEKVMQAKLTSLINRNAQANLLCLYSHVMSTYLTTSKLNMTIMFNADHYTLFYSKLTILPNSNFFPSPTGNPALVRVT